MKVAHIRMNRRKDGSHRYGISISLTSEEFAHLKNDRVILTGGVLSGLIITPNDKGAKLSVRPLATNGQSNYTHGLVISPHRPDLAGWNVRQDMVGYVDGKRSFKVPTLFWEDGRIKSGPLPEQYFNPRGATGGVEGTPASKQLTMDEVRRRVLARVAPTHEPEEQNLPVYTLPKKRDHKARLAKAALTRSKNAQIGRLVNTVISLNNMIEDADGRIRPVVIDGKVKLDVV